MSPRISGVALGRVLAVSAICAGGLAVYAGVLQANIAIDTWLVWTLLALWAYTLLFAASCLIGGNAVLRLIVDERALPPAEWVLQSMLFGVVLYAFGITVGGALCLLSPAYALALPAALIGGGANAAVHSWKRMATWWKGLSPTPLGRWVLYATVTTWGAVCLGFLYLGALHPSSVNFDAAWYHLPIAQDYAREGCLIRFVGEKRRAFPHLASLIYTWAMLVPGLEPVPVKWMMCLHLEFVVVLLRILGVVAGAQWMLVRDRTPALWVAFFLFPAIFVYDQNIGGAADQFVAFSAVPIFLALARSLPNLDPRHLSILGVALGCQILTKYQAIYLLTAVLVVLGVRWTYLAARVAYSLWRRCDPFVIPGRRLLVAPAVLFAVTAFTSAPHVVKNTLFYGNPVYPLMAGQITTSHPVRPPEPYPKRRPKREGEFAIPSDRYQRASWMVELLFNHPFATHNRTLTKHRPYIGALVPLLLPCLPFVRRPRRTWLAAGVFVLAFAVWANTIPNDRYLLAFYGIGMALVAALLVKIGELGWLARLAVAALVALQLAWGGDAMLTYGRKRVRAAMSLLASAYKKQTVEERFRTGSTARKITEATPEDARILSRNYKSLLGLDRAVLSDVREDQGYITYTGMRSPRELWRQLRDKGITHLLYAHGQREPHRLNGTILFDALVAASPSPKRFGSVRLVALAQEPPSGPATYLVLVIGQRGLLDGLYTVDQLDMDDRTMALYDPKPKPLKRLQRRNAVELLRRADACVERRGSLPEAARAHLGAEFELFERFSGGNRLYLRKKSKQRPR